MHAVRGPGQERPVCGMLRQGGVREGQTGDRRPALPGSRWKLQKRRVAGCKQGASLHGGVLPGGMLEKTGDGAWF